MSFSIKYIGAAWCGPCKTIKPAVSLISHKFAIPLTFTECDEMEQSERNELIKLPTIRVYKDDILVLEITSNHTATLELWLREHVRVNGNDEF